MRKGGREERKRAKRGGIKKKRSGGELGAAKDTQILASEILSNFGYKSCFQLRTQITTKDLGGNLKLENMFGKAAILATERF